MTPISRRRTLIAGLAAGLTFNIGGMASAGFLGLGEAFARFEIVPAGAGVVLHLALRFGIGLAGTYLYAGMTSHYGQGKYTALRVGVAIWLIGYLPSLALLEEIGFLTGTQALLSSGWGLLEACAAIGVAATVYRPTSQTP